MKTEIIRLIEKERVLQRNKWNCPHIWGQGDCSSNNVHPTVKVAVLSEECGEVSRAVLEMDEDNLKTELIQVAAVSVAWLESLI